MEKMIGKMIKKIDTNSSSVINSIEEVDSINFKKIMIIVLTCYLTLSVIFYYLAGEQLHYREVYLERLVPNAPTIELVSSTSVEQTFTTKIQRIKQISIAWGTYRRKNTGYILVQLINLKNNALVLSQTVNVSDITDGSVSTVTSPDYLENLSYTPLMLRVTAPEAVPGNAISPLINDNVEQKPGFQLYINGKSVNGRLSFSVIGQDYVWTGLYYWWFVAAFGFALLVYLMSILLRHQKGKKSLLLNALVALKKYRFLISQLVSRDFKTKYKRSIFGVFWSFLNPLLMMSVQYFVFSAIFKSDIKYYDIYLLIGVVFFNFFSEACGMTLTSVIGNANLITKIYIPKYIFPLTRLLSSVINLLISLIPLSLAVILSGLPITKAYVLVLFPLFCLAVFSLGLGLVLSASMVFFRDTQFLWNVIINIWMYATPIFYPASILPKQFSVILYINPLYYFASFTRTCILDGVSPDPRMYAIVFAYAVVMLLIGAIVFKKSQDRFIVNL